MYVLKTKGTAKIPDYVQIRDNNFILVNHFALKSLEKHIEKINLIEAIKNLEFGKLIKIS